VAGLNPDSFPFHYSTKFTDPESGFNYYGYRFYDPANGRWINRDPIGERGGVNLYGMVGNDGVNWVDLFGLEATIKCERCQNGPTKGQMTCQNMQDGKPSGDPYKTNENGYMDGYDPIPQGDYDVKPKPKKQMEKKNRSAPIVVGEDGVPWQGDERPEGTPSLSSPGMEPGLVVDPRDPGGRGGDLKDKLGVRENVRLHPNGPKGKPDSQACVTCSPNDTNNITDLMNKNLKKGGTKMTIKDVDCACGRK
jgi:RHS repeat-associated protein